MMCEWWEDGRLDGFSYAMTRYSKEILEKTIRMWQPLSEEQLTEEDAREIVENLTGFFSLLGEWERENGKEEDKT